MKASTPQSSVHPRYSSLQVTTTPRGRTVPLCYGTTKVTSEIVWVGNFHTTKYTQNTGHSSGKGMGGGSGGKGGSGGTTQFYYFAAILATLCEGPIYSFVAARNGSQWVYYDGSAPPFARPVPSTSRFGTSPGQYPIEGYPLDSYLGVSPTLYTNLLPYSIASLDSELYAMYEEQGMLDDNYNVNPSTNKGFSQNGQHWRNVGPNVWATQAFMLMYGNSPQAYPPYIGSNFPSQIDSYQSTAYWFSPAYQLGQSATPPTLDWFIVGLLPFDPVGSTTGTPIVDAEPSAVITDLITHPVRGMAIPQAGFLDQVTFASYRTYCIAGGLFLSMNLTSQMETIQIIDQIMTQTVSVSFWSEGRLKIVPWLDVTITGHGQTFVPNLTPVYTINDNHLLTQSRAGPIEVTRTTVFDTYNQLAVNFQNRALNYSTDTITVDDQGQQMLFGVRPAPPSMAHYIADQSVAAASAQLQLAQIVYNRDTYTFRLPFIFCLLEPMDILVINDAGLGIVNLPVRLQQINLDNKDEYTVTAQGLKDELFTVAARNQQVSVFTSLPGSIPPGSVMTPFIFTGPTRITGQNLEVWIAVSGQQDGWGGCVVWISTDGTNYEKTGTFWGGCRYGQIDLPLSAYGSTNPDNTDTMQVAMFGPQQQMNTVSSAQAAQGLSLCLIQTGTNFELLSYTTGTLLATIPGLGNQYALTGLYRGLAGTFGIGHNYADFFARLDNNIIRIPLNIAMLGQTLFFKFTSFNTFGGMTEGLGTVTEYQYTVIGGTSSPVGAQDLTVATNGQLTVLTWVADNSQEVVGYQVRYGPVGGNFQQAKPVLSVVGSVHTTSLIFPPGIWVFYVASFDKLGVFSSTIESTTFTVPNLQILSLEYNYGPVVHALDPGAVVYNDWNRGNATLTNCFVHPTSYVLVPTDASLASFSGSDFGWEWVDDFCITPPASSTFLSPTINIGAGATNIRGSAHLYEYLWGTSGSPAGSQIVTTLNPDWAMANLTLSNCFAHPTAWTITPTDTLAANYAGTDQGFEVFDFTVFSPPATSTVTFTMDAGAVEPIQALISTATRPSPSGSVPVMTGTINHSGDNTHWVALATGNGAGQVSGLAVDRYFQFIVTLNNSAGQLTKYPLAPDWPGAVLTNAIVHPTSYAVAPADQILASFSGSDNGWEWADNFVYSPFAVSTVSYVVNAGSATNITAGLDSNLTAGPGQVLAPPQNNLYTGTIGYSNSPSGPFTTLVTGPATGVVSGTVNAQYFQYILSLTNQAGDLAVISSMTPSVTVITPTSGGIGTLKSMLSELIIGPSQYWTPVTPQISTSANGTTWGPWQQIPSTWTPLQYIRFMVQWSETGALWPFGIDSIWLLADGTPITQSGSVTTVAGTATVTFPIQFRQVPIVTCTVQGSSSVVAAVVTSANTGFTVDTFTSSSGAAANATVNWSATGI